MKKSLVFLAALAFIGAASAQSVSFRLENSGRVWDRVETSAVVNGTGSALSHATGAQSATAIGTVSSNPIAGGQSLVLSGAVQTTGSASAYKISAGGGFGSASSQGWADANVNGYNNFSNQHGSLTMSGYTDSGMAQPVGRGVDVSVTAGRNQDGWASGMDSGSFTVIGSTSQVAVAGGATLVGTVSDVKTSHAEAEAGRISFTGTAPTGMTAAATHSLGGNVTEASGAFIDPAH